MVFRVFLISQPQSFHRLSSFLKLLRPCLTLTYGVMGDMLTSTPHYPGSFTRAYLILGELNLVLNVLRIIIYTSNFHSVHSSGWLDDDSDPKHLWRLFSVCFRCWDERQRSSFARPREDSNLTLLPREKDSRNDSYHFLE